MFFSHTRSWLAGWPPWSRLRAAPKRPERIKFTGEKSPVDDEPMLQAASSMVASCSLVAGHVLWCFFRF